MPRKPEDINLDAILQRLPKPHPARAKVNSALGLTATQQLRTSLKTAEFRLVRLKCAAHIDEELKWMTDAERAKLKRQLLTAVSDIRAELRRRQ